MLTLKTAEGMETFGKFYIGNNRERAHSIFSRLKGSNNVEDRDILYLEFVESAAGLPVDLKIITCTLEQMAENCKYIAKEVFKMNNLAG
jgi:hypothetical protein